MSNAWIRPVGPIIDHPMMQNYEFLVALNNVLAPPCFEELPMMLEMMVSGRNWVRSTPQNQFLVHQPQQALDPRERDPLERGTPPIRIRTSRPDVDHFENTSLGESEAPPPADFRICRAQRAARRRYESTWFPANQAELNDIIEAENKERARKLEVEIELDKIFNEIRERKAKIPTAKAQLSKLAEAWALEEDEKAHHAYFTWKAGFVNAFKCSPSETRVWHIIAWHKGPTVPEDVFNAIVEIADLYTEISMLQSDFEEYDISIGNNDLIRFDSVEELLNDDEAWVQGHSSRLAEMGVGDEDTIEWFGEEFQHRDLTNGFCDYAPKGQGAKMAEHALANLKARRVRLCYSTKQEVAEVKLAVGLFVRKAEQVLSAEKTRLQAEDEGKPSFNADMKAVAEACQTMVDCRVELNGLGKSKDKKQSN